MDKYEETFRTWNEVALRYKEKFMDLKIYNHTYDFFAQIIETYGADILELGCGPGNLSKYLLQKRPDFNIYGIDIAPKMIAIARQEIPEGHFTTMDIRSIDQLKGKYHGITCGFSIPYLSETDFIILLCDCFNLLHDYGFLYLSFVEGYKSQSGYITSKNGERVYFYYHSLSEVQFQLTKHGYKIINHFAVVYNKSTEEKENHIIIIAQKVLVTELEKNKIKT